MQLIWKSFVILHNMIIDGQTDELDFDQEKLSGSTHQDLDYLLQVLRTMLALSPTYKHLPN